MFSSVGATLRQSLAPPGMLGRVQGAYRAVSNSGMLAGAALGGLLTSAFGLTAPLWLGLAALTAVHRLAWRPFGALPLGEGAARQAGRRIRPSAANRAANQCS